jgi:O-antigen/teichoic acid export membrane protein
VTSIRERVRSRIDHGVVQLVRGSGFIFACRVSGAVLALLTQWVLARWLGAEGMGSYLLAYSWCILVARLTGLGYNSASPRFLGQGIALGNREIIRGFVSSTTRTVLGLGASAALIGGGAAFLILSGSGSSPWPMVIAFAAVPIMAACGILQGFALSFSWFRATFLPNQVLRPAVFLAAVAVLWALGKDVSVAGVMLLQAGAMAIALATLLAAIGGKLRREVTGVTPSYEVGLWTRTAVALLVVSLFRDYLPELSIIVAGFYLSPEEIAVFTIAYRIASLIAFVLFAVDSFAAPRSAQALAAGDLEGLQKFVERATLLAFAVSAGAVLGFWIFGRWALGLFGAEFVEGYPLLLMIGVAQLVKASVGPVIPLLTMGGHEKACLKVYGAALVMVAPLVSVLANTWGAEGVGIAVTGVIIISSVALNRMVRSLVGIRSSIFAVLLGR